jgi:hypothetical protein
LRTAPGPRLELARGLATVPDSTIETDPGTLASLLWHGRRLQDALEAGTAKLGGRRAPVRRFLRFFLQKRDQDLAIGAVAV